MLRISALARHPLLVRRGIGLGSAKPDILPLRAIRLQMRSPNEPRQGVPVPLYNLVYHDCVIEPWMMERVVDGDDYMLYALLNGGAPYLIRDAAYIGVDGDMDDEQRARTENDIERCHTVAAFHERVGMQELVRHEFVDDDRWCSVRYSRTALRSLATSIRKPIASPTARITD